MLKLRRDDNEYNLSFPPVIKFSYSGDVELYFELCAKNVNSADLFNLIRAMRDPTSSGVGLSCSAERKMQLTVEKNKVYLMYSREVGSTDIVIQMRAPVCLDAFEKALDIIVEYEQFRLHVSGT